MNKSYQPRFKTGQLVVPAYGANTVGIVEPSSQYTDGIMRYRVKFCYWPGGNAILDFPGEDSLRPITMAEWWWYRNPETGRMNIGRTRAWEFILQVAASLLCIGVALWLYQQESMDEQVGGGVLALIGAARIFFLVHGTLRNFKGKQA